MEERASAGAMTVTATLTVAIAQMARFKVFALILGLAGTGIVAQITSLQGVLLSSIPLYSGIALISALAQAEKHGRQSKGEFAGSARALALVLSIAPAVVAALAIVILILPSSPELAPLLLGLFGLPFTALAAVENSLLQSERRYRALSTTNVITALGGFTIVAVATVLGGVIGTALGISLAAILSWILSAIALHRSLRMYVPRLDLGAWRLLVRYGAGAFTAFVIASAGQAGIRALAFATLGASGAGLIHILFTLSLQFSYLASVGLGTYAQPRIAAAVAEGDRSAVLSEIAVSQRLGLAAIGFVGIVTSLCSTLIVSILFSAEFIDIATFLPFQLMGELIRVHFWLTGAYLLPMRHRRLFVGLELIVYGSFFPIAVALSPLGAAAFVIAHIVAATAASVAVAHHARKTLGLPLQSGVTILTIALAGMIGTTIQPIGLLITIPAAGLLGMMTWRMIRTPARATV